MSSVKIADLKSQVTCNVKGFVQFKSEVKQFGTGGTYMYVHLFDGSQIKLTVFGANCEQLQKVEVDSWYCFANVRVKDANKNYHCINADGLELLSSNGFQIEKMEDGPEAECGKELIVDTKPIDGKVLHTTGIIVDVDSQSDFFFMQCPKITCGKKLEQNSDEEFACTKCKTTYSVYKHHCLLNMTVQIGDEEQKVVCFNDTALQLLKLTNKEFERMVHEKAKLNDLINELCGKLYSMEIKVNKSSSSGKPQFIMEKVTENDIDDVDTARTPKKLTQETKKAATIPKKAAVTPKKRRYGVEEKEVPTKITRSKCK